MEGTRREDAGAGLTAEDLDQEQGTRLPDREAMTIIHPTWPAQPALIPSEPVEDGMFIGEGDPHGPDRTIVDPGETTVA